MFIEIPALLIVIILSILLLITAWMTKTTDPTFEEKAPPHTSAILEQTYSPAFFKPQSRILQIIYLNPSIENTLNILGLSINFAKQYLKKPIDLECYGHLRTTCILLLQEFLLISNTISKEAIQHFFCLDIKIETRPIATALKAYFKTLVDQHILNQSLLQTLLAFFNPINIITQEQSLSTPLNHLNCSELKQAYLEHPHHDKLHKSYQAFFNEIRQDIQLPS